MIYTAIYAAVSVLLLIGGMILHGAQDAVWEKKLNTKQSLYSADVLEIFVNAMFWPIMLVVYIVSGTSKLLYAAGNWVGKKYSDWFVE